MLFDIDIDPLHMMLELAIESGLISLLLGRVLAPHISMYADEPQSSGSQAQTM